MTIERIEYEIVERAWAEGWVAPVRPAPRPASGWPWWARARPDWPPPSSSSGPATTVVVYERAERPGGLLRYGIPEFKMEKAVLDRRLDQLEAEGVEFRCGVSVGAPSPDVPRAAAEDVTVAARRPTWWPGTTPWSWPAGPPCPATCPSRGAQLDGIHRAMDYLKPSNMVREGSLAAPPVTAEGKHVVIIGGGDTGADCLGTAHRQGALSVHQLEIMPEPPDDRTADNPWPTWPLILRTSSALEEGGERLFSVTTDEFVDDGTGAVAGLRGHEVELTTGPDGRPVVRRRAPAASSSCPVELVLLAMGFLGAEPDGVVADLGLELDARGSVAADERWATNVDNVFVCGDMTRGQSLIVWAIAEGRSAAAAVDRHLMGTTALPAPLRPGQVALR